MSEACKVNCFYLPRESEYISNEYKIRKYGILFYLIPFEVAWEDVGPGDLFCLEAYYTEKSVFHYIQR